MQNTHAGDLGHTELLLYRISLTGWDQSLIKQAPTRTGHPGVLCPQHPVPITSLVFRKFSDAGSQTAYANLGRKIPYGFKDQSTVPLSMGFCNMTAEEGPKRRDSWSCGSSGLRASRSPPTGDMAALRLAYA